MVLFVFLFTSAEVSDISRQYSASPYPKMDYNISDDVSVYGQDFLFAGRTLLFMST